MILEASLAECFLLVLLLSGAPLICSSVAGVLVAVLQAATQIQEQSITYVVKLLSVGAVLALLGDWFFDELIAYLQRMLESLPLMSRI